MKKSIIKLTLIGLSICYSSLGLVSAQQACLVCANNVFISSSMFIPTIVGPSGATSATFNVGTRAIGASGLIAGNTYTFSTCQGTTEDTYIYLTNSLGSAVACNNNQCGQQSEFDYVVPTTGNYDIHVSENGTCALLKTQVTLTLTLKSVGVMTNGGGNGNGNSGGNGGGGGNSGGGGNGIANLWDNNGSGIVHTTRNVGIGTSTPTESLEVVGSMNVSGQLKVGTASIIIDGSEISTSTSAPVNHIFSSSGSGNMFINSAENSFPTAADQNAHTILNGNDNTGYVGIRTSNPENLLHIRARQIDFANSNLGIRLESEYLIQPAQIQVQRSIWDIESVIEPSSKLKIGTPSLNVMTLTSAGKMGIGTSTPGEKLHVSGGNILITHSQGLKSDIISTHLNLIKLTPWAFNMDGSVSDNIIEISEAHGTILEVRVITPSGANRGFSVHDGTQSLAFFRNDGNVGIGTVNPFNKLDISGSSVIGSAYSGTQTAPSNGLLVEGGVGIGTDQPTEAKLVVKGAGPNVNNLEYIITAKNSLGGHLATLFDTNDQGPPVWRIRTSVHHRPIAFNMIGTEVMRIQPQSGTDHNVGIGTNNPHIDYKLDVAGAIRACEVKVSLAKCPPDYVFEEDYDLAPLSKVEEYIKANKHLPEIPAGTEMTENGIGLSEMTLLLLKKIEELTLHAIEQGKKMEMFEEQLEGLKN